MLDRENLLPLSIDIPADKSISQRAIILAAIADGNSRINNFLFAEDPMSTLLALNQLGVQYKIIYKDEKSTSKAVDLLIYGVGKYGLRASKNELYLGNSGTGVRLLSGLLAGQKFSSILIGDSSLSARPMARIANPLKMMGAKLQISKANTLPMKIFSCKDNLLSISYELPVDSAQVKSCLMLAGLYTTDGINLIYSSKIRNHTTRMLQFFGVDIREKIYQQDKLLAKIIPPKSLLAQEYTVPNDFSSAAFFIVAHLLAGKDKLTLKNIGCNPTRIGMLNILRDMGAKIDIINCSFVAGEEIADLVIYPSKLSGIDIDQDLVITAIDEVPIILLASACATGKTTLRNIEELRFKESDRIAAMINGLRALGVKITEIEDKIIVHGGMLTGGTVESMSDHRIAMTFIIAGFIAKGSITVKNCSCIKTSFPNFIENVTKLGLKCKAC